MSAQTKSTGPSWPPELYARARPSYPEEVVEKVVKSPSSNEPLNIVELGAGTGIATKVIIEACSGPSAHARLASYTALDASSAMMEALERSLMQAPDGLVPRLKQSGLLGADVTTDTGVATFEDFNSAQRFTGQVDLILIAQAWHWCQDWDKALCNFAKALKPGGTLALLWNLEDKDAAPWVRNAREEFEKYEGDFPQYRHFGWHAMYKQPGFAHFEVLPEVHLTRSLPTTIEGVCSRVRSKSYISVLPDDQWSQVEAKIKAFLRAPDAGISWIDEDKGIFEYPYKTALHLFIRRTDA